MRVGNYIQTSTGPVRCPVCLQMVIGFHEHPGELPPSMFRMAMTARHRTLGEAFARKGGCLTGHDWELATYTTTRAYFTWASDGISHPKFIQERECNNCKQKLTHVYNVSNALVIDRFHPYPSRPIGEVDEDMDIQDAIEAGMMRWEPGSLAPTTLDRILTDALADIWRDCPTAHYDAHNVKKFTNLLERRLWEATGQRFRIELNA